MASPRGRLLESTRTWDPPERPAFHARVNVYDPKLDAQDYEFQDRFVAFYARLLRSRFFYESGKRLIDILFSLILLALTLPVFALVALLVKATSPGPVFFKHRRVGRSGKEFCCLKFRTMVTDAERMLEKDAQLARQFETRFKIDKDPRVTRLGALLRKTCIDELPQLLQVLRGDMSLIGPRPVVKRELVKYGVYASRLLSIKPGLSGFWQACRHSDTTYNERVQMDMFYIKHRCLSLDLLLMLYTAVAVIRRRGAQ